MGQSKVGRYLKKHKLSINFFVYRAKLLVSHNKSIFLSNAAYLITFHVVAKSFSII